MEKSNAFTGTSSLIRLIIRQSRFMLLFWIVLSMLVVVSTGMTLQAQAPTQEILVQLFEEGFNDPSITALYGTIQDVNIAAFTAWRTRVNIAAFAAIFSLLFVIRHSRKEEETGRLELIGSTPIGRHASLAAVLIVGVIANVLMTLLIIIGSSGMGFPLAGTFVLALFAGVFGCFFMGIAAVAAQLTSSARVARGISFGWLGIFFFLQILINVSGTTSNILAISPFGWGILAKPYAGEQFWVLLIPIVLSTVLLYSAFDLSAKRDVGMGMIPERSGRGEAKPSFNSAAALSWRSHKNLLIIFVTTAAVIGLAIGGMAQSLVGMTSSPMLADWVARMGGPEKAFLSAFIFIEGIMITAYAIATALRIRAEEKEMRAELLLTTPVSRIEWGLSHLKFAFAGPLLILFVLGLTTGLSASAASGNSGEFLRLLLETITKIPAIWVMTGITVLILGWLPRASVILSWAAWGLFGIMVFFWEFEIISEAVAAISPFVHIHPMKETSIITLIMLTLVAVGFTAAGLNGLRRREIG